MEEKPKHPLWLAITVCAINITTGLFHNASTVALFQPFRHWDCINTYFEGSNAGSTKVPAIVGILACDLLLILAAMLPKKTVDQSKNSEERRGRRPNIAFVTTILYAFLSMVVMLVVFAIKEGHWDSIEEMNEVRNVAKMHSIFTMLFMVLVMIWKIVVPDLKIIFTSPLEESKAKIETGEKTDIENPPPKYSEVLDITIENPPPNYSEVSQIRDTEEVLEGRQKASITIENLPPKYSEVPQI